MTKAQDAALASAIARAKRLIETCRGVGDGWMASTIEDGILAPLLIVAETTEAGS